MHTRLIENLCMRAAELARMNSHGSAEEGPFKVEATSEGGRGNAFYSFAYYVKGSRVTKSRFESSILEHYKGK